MYQDFGCVDMEFTWLYHCNLAIAWKGVHYKFRIFYKAA